MNKKNNRNKGKTYQREPNLTKEDYFHIHKYGVRKELMKLIEEAKRVNIDETILRGLETAFMLMSIPDSQLGCYKTENEISTNLSALWL